MATHAIQERNYTIQTRNIRFILNWTKGHKRLKRKACMSHSVYAILSGKYGSGGMRML